MVFQNIESFLVNLSSNTSEPFIRCMLCAERLALPCDPKQVNKQYSMSRPRTLQALKHVPHKRGDVPVTQMTPHL